MKEKDLQNLRTKSPDKIQEESRKQFGLSPAEKRIVKQIRRVGPRAWSLRNLRITEEDYKKIMDNDNDEFEDVKEDEDVKIHLQDRSFRPSNFIVFFMFLWKHYAGRYKNTKAWRYVPPRNHVEALQTIVTEWLDVGTISTTKLFRISLFLYYAAYNSMYGTKVSMKKSAA